MFSLNTYPHRSDEMVWRAIDNEIVILTADGRSIHTLNRMGSAIWELCDGTRNFGEIISLICERFDVSFEEAHADIIEFAAQLSDKKILEMKEGSNDFSKTG